MAAMWLMRGAIESRANVPTQVAAAPKPAEPAVKAPQVANVMIAARDITIGQTLASEDVKWQSWPAESVSDYFFVKSEDQDAIAGIVGSASRVAMRKGEPLSTEKIIDLNGSGVMASLLRTGMRAVAVPISDVTGAGGFILPGDYVDLMLTRQIVIEELNPQTGEIDRTTTHNQTDTVLETVRVLAIDQRLGDTNENGATAVGNTATVELLPEQAELIALTRQIAKQERGFMTLSLRSFAELVAQYDDKIDQIMPKTVLDLQAIARAKVERAKELRMLSEEYRKEQELMAELERQRLAEEAELARAEAEAEKAAEKAAAQATKVEAAAALPSEPKQDEGIVLIRNGAPIIVRTVSDPNANGGQ
jgi:pilus assembly protein CpaB